jgi:hypothetical protein
MGMTPAAMAKTYQVRTDKSFLLLFPEKEGLLPPRVSVSKLVGMTPGLLIPDR